MNELNKIAINFINIINTISIDAFTLYMYIGFFI